MATYRFLQLDVFTERAFGGNPLAVIPEAEGLSTEDMLKISREMNLSETVFVLQPEEVDENPTAVESQKVLHRLRIFTPTREIPFAGHPVVGTWNALASEGVAPLPETGTGWTRILHEIGIGILPGGGSFEGRHPLRGPQLFLKGRFRL